jgi:hypothetical protein
MSENTPTPEKFEDNIETIDKEIAKRKHKWTLTSLHWLDFDDISQILRIHIFNKWHLYDHNKPLIPWINTIISHQIKNLIRNNYSNFSRPCLKCAAAEGEDLCSIYGKQCSTCPLYAYWEKNKKDAYSIKIPLSMEYHLNEIHDIQAEDLDIDRISQHIHFYLKKELKPIEYKIYNLLYMQHKSEQEVAKLMDYKTSENGRSPGYKQIKNVKKIIISKVKRGIQNGDIDISHG